MKHFLLLGALLALLSFPLFLEVKFYELALKKCSANSSSSEWSIHGLWPQYTLSKWPSFCHKFDFNYLALKPFKARLNQNWYSCWGNNTNYHFWKHEYLKHGTCSPFNETEYFNTTLNLFNWVKTKGIIQRYCANLNSSLQCLIPFNLNLTLRQR